MDFTQITEPQKRLMLDTIGVKDIEELFSPIPKEQRLKGELNIPNSCSELEVLSDLESLAGKNRDTGELTCFLGCGAYDHFIPTVVDALASRGEFVTAYTPYQAEASQGTLQAFYEFQTMICQITGSDIANASLYESATAVAEAVLMARSSTRRTKVLISSACLPDAVETLATYAEDQDIEVVKVPTANGRTDKEKLKTAIDDKTAAVVIQFPNFFGVLEDLEEIISIAHQAGALAIVSFDPIASGVFKRPGDLGADVVVGEGQALGIPLQYGAPYLGFMAAKEQFMRKLPGRIVGAAEDKDGCRGFCLVLQTREQHIKRERATSNVCTNQGLMAMRASIYMASVGKQGLAKIASLCLDKAHYAAAEICKLDGYSLKFDAPFFKEFVIKTDRNVEKVLSHCRSQGISAGVAMSKWFKDMDDCFAVAVTEKRTRREIDQLVQALKQA